MSLSGIASRNAERLQAGCSPCLQRQHPDRPCTTLHFSRGVSQELSKLNTFSDGCWIHTSSHLLPFCFRPADAHVMHWFWKGDHGQAGHFGKEGLWSLFFNLLSEQPISVLLALCKSSLKPSQQKMQRTFLCCPPPSSNESSANHELSLELLQAGAAIWKHRPSPGTGLCWDSCARQLLPTSTVPTFCSAPWLLLSRFAG